VIYPDDDGRLGYYDVEGRALRKQFLRSPLKFSRITSRFSMSRFHPVLKRRLPHYGVDYGAPVGTSVLVTADGTVTFLGRNGGAGRMIRVRHPNGYETHYLHLSRYASGIRKGARVVQGQVIGYVGSSGLSTGPHLDYRVQQNGRWINPLTISSPPTKPLDASRLQRFLAHALAVLELLEGREAPVGARC
jgi:murein DD-endopeptidase MepM/ murein hydrolase activator NlpD